MGPAIPCSSDPPHRQDGGGSDDGAESGDHIKHAVAAATMADRQDGRRDRRRDGKGKRAGDVEYPEILGRVAFVGQHSSLAGLALLPVIPVAAWEFSLGAWLAFKGFKPSPITAEMDAASTPPAYRGAAV